jgi:hypothetical protein
MRWWLRLLSLPLALIVLGFVWNWAIEQDKQWRKELPKTVANDQAQLTLSKLTAMDEEDQTNAANPGRDRKEEPFEPRAINVFGDQ